MRNCRKQFFITFSVVLIAGVAGAAVGLLTGRALALNEARQRLVFAAGSVEQALDSHASDTRHMLAAMNASPFAFCSEKELDYFRHMIYQSSFLREGGRMRNGRVECSAVVGAAARTVSQIKPGVLEPDGEKLYWDITAFRMGMQPVTTVQIGDSYVVSDFRIRREGIPAFLHLNVHMRGAVGPGVDAARGNPAMQFAADGETTMDEVLYSTRCSTRYPHCVTASISVSDALHADCNELVAVIVLCALASCGFSTLLSMLYTRNCSMEHQLRRALARDEMHVFYQPIVDLATGCRVGAEALARWNGEDGLPVSPEVFVRVAEQRGFAGEITRRVLNRTLRDMAPVIRTNPEFCVSVNVAAADMSDTNFLPMLEEAIERHGVPRRNLIIELTETCTAHRDRAIETIRRLREAGHAVHIDDFGTGYSSLSYLKDLAVDAIKIDRSFTQSIGTESVTVAILPQILAMAEALNLQIVVEGIETAQQAAYFSNDGKRILAQGWLYGHATPIGQFVGAAEARECVRGSEPLSKEQACRDDAGFVLSAGLS